MRSFVEKGGVFTENEPFAVQIRRIFVKQNNKNISKILKQTNQ